MAKSTTIQVLRHGSGRLVPQSGVGQSSSTGVTQLVNTAAPSSPTKTIAGLVLRLSVSITGTAPGTARGISKLVNSWVVTNGAGTKVVNCKGSALTAMAVDSFSRLESGLIPRYQLYNDTVTAATGVTAVAVFFVAGRFPGGTYSSTVNLNAATATGYISPSAATYQSQLATIEVEGGSGEKPESITGEYFSGTATYTPQSQINSKHVTLAVDNAEIGAIVNSIKIGGRTFSTLDIQLAEDLAAALIPYGAFTMSGAGSVLANNQPQNPETGNVLYVAVLEGPQLSPSTVSFTASETFMVITRVPLA